MLEAREIHRVNIGTRIFFQSDHNGMKDLSVMIIDKTDVKDPTRREGFWAYKLNSFIPLRLSSRDFL